MQRQKSRAKVGQVRKGQPGQWRSSRLSEGGKVILSIGVPVKVLTDVLVTRQMLQDYTLVCGHHSKPRRPSERLPIKPYLDISHLKRD